MRNWGDIANDREIEADRLQGAHGGFTTRTWSLHPDFHFLEPVAHGLTRSVLRHELSRVGRAFARAFEANFARARPTDHFSGEVGDGDDGVVEGREDMRDPSVNVLASLCLDDLWLLIVRAIERKILLNRFRRLRGRLLGFGSFLCRFGSSFRGSCGSRRSGRLRYSRRLGLERPAFLLPGPSPSWPSVRPLSVWESFSRQPF